MGADLYQNLQSYFSTHLGTLKTVSSLSHSSSRPPVGRATKTSFGLLCTLAPITYTSGIIMKLVLIYLVLSSVLN